MEPRIKREMYGYMAEGFKAIAGASAGLATALVIYLIVKIFGKH